jgi:hypothetical protein
MSTSYSAEASLLKSSLRHDRTYLNTVHVFTFDTVFIDDVGQLSLLQQAISAGPYGHPLSISAPTLHQ